MLRNLSSNISPMNSMSRFFIKLSPRWIQNKFDTEEIIQAPETPGSFSELGDVPETPGSFSELGDIII